MAKRVPTPEPAKRPNRKGVPYHFWLDGVISEALDAYLASLKPQPTTTAVLELFIEECLQRRGYLPPPTA